MIPQELKDLDQWVCADPVGKRPINPRNGKMASPTDKRTWGTFQQASAFMEKTGLVLGFVLTEEDPYCIIDLDNKKDNPATEEQLARHTKILEAFDSYTEISPSGQGVHIIVKATTPKGFNKDKVELYSSGRYMTMTGNVLGEVRPIREYQELVNKMVLQMSSLGMTKVSHIDISTVDPFELEELHEEILNDPYVRDEYELLCNGDWEGRLNYQSQSDADFNLAMIIAEKTESNELAKALFMMSGMYRESKPKPYLDYTFTRARSNVPPPQPDVDLSALKASMAPPPAKPPLPKPRRSTQFPPGLVGEVAEYIYSSAIRPVKEMALAAAIGMVAGISARSYSISGTGLNQYLVLLAGTGTGKEGMASGVDALYSAAAKDAPPIYEFSGPASFSSGQALMKHIAEQPCFLSILGEFGLLMQAMGGNQAAAHLVMYRQALLNLYTKSGPNAVVNPSVYAKKEDSSEMVRSPNVSLLGESTPEAFYAALSEDLIAEGLIPRFLVIEYRGKRVAKNPNAFQPPPANLVKKLVDLTSLAMHTANNETCCQVLTTHDSEQLLDQFDTYADDQINGGNNEVRKQLWNRAHLKALRLAALIAVGENFHRPVISVEVAKWAIEFVRADIENLIQKFEAGAIGSGREKHEAEIRDAIDAYFAMDEDTLRNSYKVPAKLLGQPVIPFGYIRRRLRSLAAFKNDPKGAPTAINEAIKDLVAADVLVELPRKQVLKEFSLTSAVYAKGSQW